ncbi:Glycosyltransferase [hydrothermal vent metagenome]|uniref:Glycosyltransferase n=1 Tax=hydrothermal vent metagenome TaxID=652676 RepID=A0A3B0ZED1_9ZZZZ
MCKQKPYRYPDACIVIFARAPEYGKVKTRLAAGVGADAALEAYRSLLEQTVLTAADSQLAPIELYVEGNLQDPLIEHLAQYANATVMSQQGDDLGARMYHALQGVLQHSSRALIIGTDCPLMNGAYLESALQCLTPDCEVAIGPSEDGGYVLIGATMADKRIFRNITWGSNSVMQQTRDALYHANIRFDELDVLWDVDLPEDYWRWKNE